MTAARRFAGFQVTKGTDSQISICITGKSLLIRGELAILK